MDIARHGTAQHVEKFVRLYRQAKRAEETEGADTQHRERSLTWWYEHDGCLVLHGRFPPENRPRYRPCSTRGVRQRDQSVDFPPP